MATFIKWTSSPEERRRTFPDTTSTTLLPEAHDIRVIRMDRKITFTAPFMKIYYCSFLFQSITGTI